MAVLHTTFSLDLPGLQAQLLKAQQMYSSAANAMGGPLGGISVSVRAREAAQATQRIEERSIDQLASYKARQAKRSRSVVQELDDKIQAKKEAQLDAMWERMEKGWTKSYATEQRHAERAAAAKQKLDERNAKARDREANRAAKTEQMLELKNARDRMDMEMQIANMKAMGGATLLAMTAKLATSSVVAYDSFERFRLSMEALIGGGAAAKLTKQIDQYAIKSDFTAESLRSVAQTLLALGTPADKLFERTKMAGTLTFVAGGNSDTLYRLGLALSQIESIGYLRGQERNQLAQAGVPISKILASMGIKAGDDLNSKNASASAVFAAMQRYTDSLGDVQGKLAERSPLTALQNTWERLMLALRPSAALLAFEIIRAANAAMMVLDVFTKLHPVIGGGVGLIFMLGAAALGFRMLLAPLIITRSHVGQLGFSALDASWAMDQFALKVGLAAGVSTRSGALGMGANFLAGQAGANTVAGGAGGWMSRLGPLASRGGTAIAGKLPIIGLIVTAITAAMAIRSSMQDDIDAQNDASPGASPTRRSDYEDMQASARAAR